ncbi:MAG TPA: DUF1269 domain-containing protein [Solirubrobacterales bacterium]
MPELIAIAYTEETVAAQAAAELDRCAAEISLDPDATGVIVAERNGNHQLLTSRHPGATAAWSRFWGVAFGALMNESEPSELDLSFRQQVKGLLRPGSSVLLVAVRRVPPRTVLAAVSQYRGKPLTCPLGAEATAGLWGDQRCDQ